jgi:hypothetical protein
MGIVCSRQEKTIAARLGQKTVKASDRKKSELEISFDSGLEKQNPRECLNVSLSEIPLCHARLKLFDLRPHEQRPREDSGIYNRISIHGRAVRLCHMAKETPARGETFGLRWCPPVPPVPRRDI